MSCCSGRRYSAYIPGEIAAQKWEEEMRRAAAEGRLNPGGTNATIQPPPKTSNTGAAAVGIAAVVGLLWSFL
jgi:hypothetical protein